MNQEVELRNQHKTAAVLESEPDPEMDGFGKESQALDSPKPREGTTEVQKVSNNAEVVTGNDGSGLGSPKGTAAAALLTNNNLEKHKGELNVKIICLGDSAVGKSKLLDRFIQDSFKSKQLSTFALTIYKHKTTVAAKPVTVDFWDTAGQERFSSLHPSYYHQAHACVMVFDATRKVTYKNLPIWYKELREYRPEIPCLLAVNKIDANFDMTSRTFGFAEDNGIPLYYVSAADGTNVVKLFRDAISAAVGYKQNPSDWKDQLMIELERGKGIS